MDIASVPADITGLTVIPDLSVLRPEYEARLGQQAGNLAADALPIRGWYVAYDMRSDGIECFICEREKPDGSIQSVSWDARHIRRVCRPR